VLPWVLGDVLMCLRDSNARVRGAAEGVLGAMAAWAADGGDGTGALDGSGEDAGTTASPAAPPGRASQKCSACAWADSAPQPRTCVRLPFPRSRCCYLTIPTVLWSPSSPAAGRSHARAGAGDARRRLCGTLLQQPPPDPPPAPPVREEPRGRRCSHRLLPRARQCRAPARARPAGAARRDGARGLGRETKNRLRTKIKGVLRRLARRVGLEAVAAHVPAADTPLVAYLSKMQEQRSRRAATLPTPRATALLQGQMTTTTVRGRLGAVVWW